MHPDGVYNKKWNLRKGWLSNSTGQASLVEAMQANERAIKQQSELCDDEFNKQMEQYR